MAGDLVLITGVTGHLGFRVLRYALEEGYQVRAAVRSESKISKIRNNSALEALKIAESQLTFTIVPDILDPRAYSDAIKDVKYVIHVASPISSVDVPNGDYDKHIIQPAIRGTTAMLEAAKTAPSVKRVIITSSAVALVPLAFFMAPTKERITAEHRTETPKGPFTQPFQAYHASKVSALNNAESWMRDEKPHFDVIHIHPSYIEGRNDLSTTLADFEQGTNRLIVGLARGEKAENPNLFSVNHLDDSAWVHVRSLRPEVSGNQSFLVSNPGDEGNSWSDVKTFAQKHFPDAVKREIFSLEGHIQSLFMLTDAKKTEETFGFRLKGFEEMVVSVLGHYLEVYEKTNRI